jgi:pyridoxal phosphate enzyme (YggS family)
MNAELGLPTTSTDIGRNVGEIEERVAHAAQRAGRSPGEVTVVAVAKTVQPQAIREAFEAGITHFGENRVQEAQSKIGQLSINPPPTWHMVGHLQTNKARLALGLFDVIQSVDSVRLAEAISRHAQRDVPVLIQVNIAGETTKFGFPSSEVDAAVNHMARLPHLDIKGLMTIAPLTADAENVRPFFRQLRLLRDSLGLEHLSMGMTDDFEVAIEEGATMLRVGRAIFGERKG